MADNKNAIRVQLKRQIGLKGAVLLGLGSIIGTGVFVSTGLVAGVAGPAALVAVFLAGLLALCNAFSSAQLAANYPTSGGSFEFGYRVIAGPVGFTAGWMFVIAKSASAATAALGAGGYLLGFFPGVQGEWGIPVAIVMILVVTGIVINGIRSSNRVNFVLVAISLASLGFFVLAGIPVWAEKGWTHFIPFWGFEHSSLTDVISGILHATALMFVAYTGYGRVATLGEEIVEPKKNLPKAIQITLGLTIVIYAVVLFIAISAVGHQALYDAARGDSATLVTAAREFGVAGSEIYLAIGAVTAMFGVLLNLVLGLSRMVLAMSRRGHFPKVFRKINASGTTPVPAVALTAVIVMGLTLLGDVYVTWSLSAFTVLVYYGITNWAAAWLTDEQRMYPRIWAWAGLIGCFFLAFWVDSDFWLWGLGLITIGLMWYGMTAEEFKDRRR